MRGARIDAMAASRLVDGSGEVLGDREHRDDSIWPVG
jgi:hypothetical protein